MSQRKRAADTRPSFIHRTGKKSKVIYLDAEELQAIEKAAGVAGVSAAQFIVTAANKAAAKALKNSP
jgi:uncharacterized protein (DUF1778 family)